MGTDQNRPTDGNLHAAREYVREAKAALAAGDERGANLSLDLGELEIQALESTTATREPGLAQALARGLDPDEAVLAYAVTWQEGGRWHGTHFAAGEDARAFVLTLPRGSGAYIVGTSAPRRDVHPPREVR